MLQGGDEEAVRAKLSAARPEDAPRRFVPLPEQGLARVCGCYDGDTVTVLFFEAGHLVRMPLRVRGVDAPERRGRGEAESRCAGLVRDVVARSLLDRVVRVTVHGLDKYGRLLGDVELPAAADGSDGSGPRTLSDFLLRHDLARPYDGGARAPFSAEEEARVVANATRLLDSLAPRRP